MLRVRISDMSFVQSHLRIRKQLCTMQLDPLDTLQNFTNKIENHAVFPTILKENLSSQRSLGEKSIRGLHNAHAAGRLSYFSKLPISSLLITYSGGQAPFLVGTLLHPENSHEIGRKDAFRTHCLSQRHY